jgi:hypothetical protein
MTPTTPEASQLATAASDLSSFQLLQQVQTILQENNDSKQKNAHLEQELASLRQEHADLQEASEILKAKSEGDSNTAKEQVQKLKEDLSHMQKQNDETNRSLSTLKLDKHHLEEEKSKLQKQTQSLEALKVKVVQLEESDESNQQIIFQLKEKNQILGKETAKVEEIFQENSSLNDKLLHLEKNNDSQDQEIARLQVSLERRNKQHTSLQEQASSLNVIIQDLKQKAYSLETRNDENREKLITLEDQNKNFEDENIYLQAQVTQLEEKNESDEANISTLKDENMSLKEENSEVQLVQSRIQVIGQEMAALKNENSGLRDENLRVRGEIESNSNLVAKLEAHHKEINEASVQQLLTLKDRNQSLEDEKLQLLQKIDDNSIRVNELKMHVSRLQEQNETDEARNQELFDFKDKKFQLQEEIKNYSKLVDELKAQVSQFQQRNEEDEARITSLNDENASLKKQNAHLQQEKKSQDGSLAARELKYLRERVAELMDEGAGKNTASSNNHPINSKEWVVLKSENQKLRDVTLQLQGKIEEKSILVADFQAQLSQLLKKETNETNGQNLTVLNEDNQTLKNENSQLQEQINDNIFMVKELQAQVLQLQGMKEVDDADDQEFLKEANIKVQQLSQSQDLSLTVRELQYLREQVTQLTAEMAAKDAKLENLPNQFLLNTGNDTTLYAKMEHFEIQIQANDRVVAALKKENSQVNDENMQLRVQLQLQNQASEQIIATLMEDKEALQTTISEKTKILKENAHGSSSLDQAHKIQMQESREQHLKGENDELNEKLVQLTANSSGKSAASLNRDIGVSDIDFKTDLSNSDGDEFHDTITQLQNRIMTLVEEKLVLQQIVDRLQYQQFDNPESPERRPPLSQQKQQPLVVSPFQKREAKLLPPIVVDENTQQVDILQQTMERKHQSKGIPRRITDKVFIGSTKPGLSKRIDVEATRQLYLEQKRHARQKEIKGTSRLDNPSAFEIEDLEPNTPTAGIGRESWVSNRDHGMVSNEEANTMPDISFSKQGQRRFVNSAMSKQKTTTWTRIRDTIAGGGNDSVSQRDIEDFRRISEQQQQEIRNLSVQDSMLDSSPNKTISSSPHTNISGRYNSSDSVNLAVGDNKASSKSKVSKTFDQDTVVETKSETVTASSNSAWPVSRPTNKKEKPIGGGMEIDQSNLLGYYVNKQKAVETSTTIGYLTNIIYGDTSVDESKTKRHLLKRHLAEKKKEEAVQREAEKTKQSTGTLFSPFL